MDAILRLEQLFPINEELVEALAPYKDGTPLVWVQEEPRNYGAWYYLLAVLRNKIGDRLPISCVSRAGNRASSDDLCPTRHMPCRWRCRVGRMSWATKRSARKL